MINKSDIPAISRKASRQLAGRLEGLFLHMKVFVYIILSVISAVVISCTDANRYPTNINEAIRYFYLENKNDSVVMYVENQLSQTNTSENRMVAEIIKAGALCELGKVDAASAVLQGVKPGQNDNVKCWYKSIKGLVLFRQEKLTESYQSLISTLTYKNIDKRALALNERIIARILFYMAENQQAMEHLLLSNKHFNEEGLEKGVAVNQKILGRYYMRMKNYKQAFSCFKEAEYTFKKYQDNAELFYAYINLVDYYINTDSFEKASVYVSLCDSLSKSVDDNQMRCLVNHNLGELATKQKRYADAIKYSTAVLNVPSGYSDAGTRCVEADINLSKTYNLLNDKQKAQFYAKQAKTTAKLLKEDKLRYTIYRQLAESYLTPQGKSLSYMYLDSATQWLDNAFTSSAKASESFYNAKTDLIKAGIKMEKMQQQEKMNQNIFIFITLSLLAVTLFSFVVYRLQHSKNKVLQELVNKNLKILEDERALRSLLKTSSENKKINRKSTEPEKSELLYQSLINWLENDKKFRRNDLSLETVSKELNSNREYLSRSINNKEIRFTDLINKYRIEEAIEILSNPQNIKSRYTLSNISTEVGFNSDSVFIDAFKKQTGITPNQFRVNAKSMKK